MPPKPTKKPDSKASILEAAAQIVERAGAANLTIDAVAAEAGLSKGGVLYHFPSKQKLLEGMLERLLQRESSAAAAHLQRLREVPNAVLRAELLSAPDALHGPQQAMSLAILAAGAESPELLGPARTHLQNLFARIKADSADVEGALVLMFAAQGIRFLDMLNLQPLSAADLDRLHQRLLELAAAGP
jgi:AcrR family transcriptional regulator